MKLASFKEAFAFGTEGEHLVADLLVRQGYAVVPFYLFERVKLSPAILSEVRGIALSTALPDLLCYAGGRAFWVEVKRKKRWIHYDNEIGPETGVDASAVRDYAKVSEITGTPVVLVFVHEGEGEGVYYGSLDRVAPLTRYWDGRGPNRARISDPMQLFPRRALRALVPSEPLALDRA